MAELPPPLISVVIPCYNSGQFLPDALASVLGYAGPEPYEVIVVDDGSTDELTQEVLRRAAEQGCRVFRQPNAGPAAARNTGIAQARGEFILFLDSDNKIRHDYLTQGVAVLRQYPRVGVVYGRANFFGDDTAPRFTGQPFDSYKLLSYNFIDMCSVIRRRMWEELGGLDENRLIIGHEDWEFWIRAFGAGWQFHYLDQVLFDYRIRHNSLITQAIIPEAAAKMKEYIFHKHTKIYLATYERMFQAYDAYQYDKARPVRSLVKFLYLKYKP